jgi:hypothetical protein
VRKKFSGIYPSTDSNQSEAVDLSLRSLVVEFVIWRSVLNRSHSRSERIRVLPEREPERIYPVWVSILF